MKNEGHHEWAEYLDNHNRWVALDFDKRLYVHHKIVKPYIGHIDLVYSAEENPISLLASKHGSNIHYMSKTGSWLNGKFGYRITNNCYPDSFTVENTFEIY